MDNPAPLGPEHRSDFEAFECTLYRQRWTADVQEVIRARLADELADGRTRALGWFDDRGLAALIAWVPNKQAVGDWRVVVLACNKGRHGHGYGGKLKKAVMDLARAEGAETVSSLVHRDNDRMLDINAKLGAVLRPYDLHREYFVCVIGTGNVGDDA